MYLRADVAGTSGSQGTATGCVTFTDNGSPIPGASGTCPYPLNSQGYTDTQAGLFTLGVGLHSIGATYSGDASFAAGSAATPAPLTITQAPTNISGDIPSTVQEDGGTFTVGAFVYSNVGLNPWTNQYTGQPPPSGTVTFLTGNTPFATLPVIGTVNAETEENYAVANSGSLPGSALPHGYNSITVAYSGDVNYAASTAPAGRLLVAYSTVTSVSAAPSSEPEETDFTVAAQVMPATSQATPVTGSVEWIVDNEVNGANSKLSANGQAQFSFGFANPGPHTFGALYSGDSNYLSSQGQTNVTVLAPDFTLTTAPANSGTIQIAAPGQASSPLTLSITAVNGYNGTIDFTAASCFISPAGSESSCSFNPPSIAGAGNTQVTIQTTAPGSALLIQGKQPRPNWKPIAIGSAAALALAPLFLALTMKRRAWRLALAMAAAAALVATVTGCGAGSKDGLQANSGTPTNVTYTVTVTATATGGQPTHTVNFTFVVP